MSQRKTPSYLAFPMITNEHGGNPTQKKKRLNAKINDVSNSRAHENGRHASISTPPSPISEFWHATTGDGRIILSLT